MKTNQTPSEVEEKIEQSILIGFLYGIQSELLDKEEVLHRVAGFKTTKGYAEAKQQLTALIEQANVEARLDELYEAVDVQVKHLPMYLISRIETLTTKESEVNHE